MQNLLFNCGLGDFLQFDSFLTTKQRQGITTIVWQSPTRHAYEHFISGNPEWSHVNHVDYPAPFDWSPFTYQAVFNRLPFTGSSFLRGTVPNVEHLDLPERFAVIQPSTPFNDRGVRLDRDMRPSEWLPVLEWLDERGLSGVVLNAAGGSPVPRDARLLDLSGKTSLRESVAVLRRASGYIGIDSFLAILATQLFDQEHLRVRTQNAYLVENAGLFYPPHRTGQIGFLYPDFTGKPYRVSDRAFEPVDTRMLITIHREMLVGNRVHMAGSIVEVPEYRAKELIRLGHAVVATVPEIAREDAPIETAVIAHVGTEQAVKNTRRATRYSHGKQPEARDDDRPDGRPDQR